MNQYGITHEAKSKYAYAYDENTLHLRLRTIKGDVKKASVVYGDPFYWTENGWKSEDESPKAMHIEFTDAHYDYWLVEVTPTFKRMRYGFVLEDDHEKLLYGGHGFFDMSVHPEADKNLRAFFNFPYLNDEDRFKAPKWVKDAVWYQIFPERFANGDPSINLKGTLSWGSKDPVNNEMLFGGDLKGVIDHLDDIKALGVTGIYFTPIFEAPTTHKYDTIDYFKIDPAFGTNETFKTLVEKAHEKGIKVMLDAVFNHCGFKHPYFQDVVEKGMASEYAQCFHILDTPVVNFELSKEGFPNERGKNLAGKLNYETFAFTPNMPKWRTGNPVAEKYLLDVATHWIKAYDIDGWRLDVSNEVSHDFWRKFKVAVESVKPDVFILGENWDNSDPWLKGDQFHSVMNYEFTYAVWQLLGTDPEYADFDVTAYQCSISALLASYPHLVCENLFTLLDSHDTSRIKTIMGGSSEKVKLAYLLQMTFPGCPSVYYGSEIGLMGENDGNRVCMIWDEERQDLDIKAHVKNLIALRHKNPAMKSVHLTWLKADENGRVLAFRKTAKEQVMDVYMNLTDEAVDFVTESGEALSLSAYGYVMTNVLE